MKPILFNTKMVQAILDGRKTVTRRVIKSFTPDDAIWGYSAFTPKDHISCRGIFTDEYGEKFFKLPCSCGDILYIRETWCQYGKLDDCDRLIDGTEEYYYRADGENPTPFNYFLVQHSGWDEHRETPVWRPSIHMPKEAARIFLQVTGVRVERLQDITEDGAIQEGCIAHGGNLAIDDFGAIWDGMIKKADRLLYGWDANPWVWVIDFERCGRPEP